MDFLNKGNIHMKKIIAVACLSLATLGFSATSVLAAKNVASTEPSVITLSSMQIDAISVNLLLASKKIISSQEWNSNFRSIVHAKTELEIINLYNSLVGKLATP